MGVSEMNWLLIRGWAREKRHWGSFLPKLQKAFPKAQITCLDLPGVGTEIDRDCPSSIAEITDDLRRRWQALPHKKGPSYVFSLSMGSMISLDWVKRYPEDFQGIVIMNTSAANLSLPWNRLNWKMIPSLIKTASVKDPVLREKNILKLTTAMQKDLDGLAREWASFAPEASRIRKTALKQLQAAVKFIAPKSVEVEGLLLSSLKDRFTHPSCSQALAQSLRFTHSVHPLAGHDLSLDDPDWVIEQIKTFKKFLSRAS